MDLGVSLFKWGWCGGDILMCGLLSLGSAVVTTFALASARSTGGCLGVGVDDVLHGRQLEDGGFVVEA